MSDIVDVKDEVVESSASGISGASSFLTLGALSPLDTQTKLTANGASQNAYIHSQYLVRMLGNNLEKEVANIRSIGAAFAEYDTMMAQLLENKIQYSVLTPPITE